MKFLPFLFDSLIISSISLSGIVSPKSLRIFFNSSYVTTPLPSWSKLLNISKIISLSDDN